MRSIRRGVRGLAALMATAFLVIGPVASAVAATPTPAPGGDPRSSGQGPGLVGDPAFALLAVLAIGLGALVLTLIYVRLTGGRRAG